jgi:ABC-type transporter Mla maintaining outer membrane lipid asymmetry ATPase subunit MlaF
VTPVLEITGVLKNYQSLRPLRLQSLTVAPGERVALSGFDAGAAEVLVNLITGASLPDQGEVRVLGQLTSDIAGGDEWLKSLERFGIVSPRGVLLEAATVEQNLAMPFSLDIDPVPPELSAKVADLARSCGMASTQGVTGEAAPEVRARLHLARAIALEPALLVLEHPTAALPESARASFADDIVAVTDARHLAALVITQDDDFARRVAGRALRLEPATGALKPVRRGWFR